MPARHVPAGHSNGGQFTGASNAPRPANPSTRGYERMRAGHTAPILQPFSKDKSARARAEARNVERVRRLEGKLGQAWAELQLARRAGDRAQEAAWSAETARRYEAYMAAYREEAKARGVSLPPTRRDKAEGAAKAAARRQGSIDKQERALEARREAARSTSVFPKLVEAQRTQKRYGAEVLGIHKRPSAATVNRKYAEYNEALEASTARRLGKEKPAPKARAPRKPKASAPKSLTAHTIYAQVEEARAREDFAEEKRLQGIIKRRKSITNDKPAPAPRKPKASKPQKRIPSSSALPPNRTPGGPMPWGSDLRDQPKKQPRKRAQRKATTSVPRQGKRTPRTREQAEWVYSEARRGLRNRRARGG